MKKKLLSVILSVITAVTMSAVPIYAVELDGSESDVVEKVEAEESVGTGDTAIDTGETNTIEIKSDDLNSSSEWKEQINKIGKDILI